MLLSPTRIRLLSTVTILHLRPGLTWAMTLKRSTWFDAATTT
jgi:hypothetical protein